MIILVFRTQEIQVPLEMKPFIERWADAVETMNMTNVEHHSEDKVKIESHRTPMKGIC